MASAGFCSWIRGLWRRALRWRYGDVGAEIFPSMLFVSQPCALLIVLNTRSTRLLLLLLGGLIGCVATNAQIIWSRHYVSCIWFHQRFANNTVLGRTRGTYLVHVNCVRVRATEERDASTFSIAAAKSANAPDCLSSVCECVGMDSARCWAIRSGGDRIMQSRFIVCNESFHSSALDRRMDWAYFGLPDFDLTGGRLMWARFTRQNTADGEKKAADVNYRLENAQKMFWISTVWQRCREQNSTCTRGQTRIWHAVRKGNWNWKEETNRLTRSRW